MAVPIAGWYADPQDPTKMRWWDGDAWTGHVRPHPALTPPQQPPVTPALVPAAAPAVAPALAPTATPAVAPAAAPTAVAPAATTTTESGMSIGRALLPPLPSKSSAADDPERATALLEQQRHSSPIVAAIMAGVVLVLVVLGVVLFMNGTFDRVLGGQSERVASSDAVQVAEGDGYSIEVPKAWTAVDLPPEAKLDAAFGRVDGVGVAIAVGHDVGNTSNLADPAVRAAAFDTLGRVQTAAVPGAAVVSRAAATLNGEPAEVIILEGTDGDGVRARIWEIGAVHDGSIYLLMFAGPADVATADEPAFQEIASSLRFT
jgi:Protein of unknown function (DUF2510)